MKKLNLIIALIALTATVSLTTSCQKDEFKVNNDTTITEDDALAEGIFSNITTIADEAYDNGKSGYKSGTSHNVILSNCATITLDLKNIPYVLTIDFGETNCLCTDGRYRRGKIIVDFNGGYRQAGTVINYNLDNYHVDDNHAEGTMVITNMGFNADSNMYYTIEVAGLIHKANNGGTITWNSSQVREWIEGRTTWFPADDIYLITGIANGVTAYGQAWSREITNALRVELSCNWIVSGTIELEAEGTPLVVLDFGDGECDNIATALIDGTTYTIFLP